MSMMTPDMRVQRRVRCNEWLGVMSVVVEVVVWRIKYLCHVDLKKRLSYWVRLSYESQIHLANPHLRANESLMEHRLIHQS